MKCVIRRRGLFLNLPGLWYIHGTGTPDLGLARVFRTQREALAYLAKSDLPKDECAVVQVVIRPGGYIEEGSQLYSALLASTTLLPAMARTPKLRSMMAASSTRAAAQAWRCQSS